MAPETNARNARAGMKRGFRHGGGLYLDVARRQRTKFWELRAAISRARFWRDRGMRTEASALLAPLYDWFTEGFDALDLKEAKALLDELAQ